MSDAPRPTQFGGGVQSHHVRNLDGAQLGLVDAVQWLKGAVEVSGREDIAGLLDEAQDLCQRIGVAHRAARERWLDLHNDDSERFYRCNAGFEPWPDERPEGFVPVCTCDRACLYHHTDAANSTLELDCNCAEVCPRHLIPREPGDRKRIAQLTDLPRPFPRGRPRGHPQSWL